MSRYVCDFLVNLSAQHVRAPLRKLLAACGLEPIYDLEDYLMAREIPGRVSFARLVTAEVLIDVTNATHAAVKLSFVLKNTDTTSLEIPAVEVTLTDSQDQTLMRRVLTPGQFGAAAITLGAHLELSGAVSLKVSGEDPRGASLSQAAFLPVTGYRLLAFYP